MIPRMERSVAHLVAGILIIKQLNCQICNLGMHHRMGTSLSTIYVYSGISKTTPEKALDGKYYVHHLDCANSDDTKAYREAWWEVTLKSISKIFKVNLVFREVFVRHAGYYLFITNQTVNASDLIHLDPVYHDEEPSPSQQNTIIFPAGHSGVQVYLYINHSNPTTTSHAIIEPCEVEIYGCVEDDISGCACTNTSIDGNPTVLWNTSVVFDKGSLALTCDDAYLSIMNMSDLVEHENFTMLLDCDGKQQCTIDPKFMQNISLSFYCQGRCLNEIYANAFFKNGVVEDLGVEYQPNASNPFTAFLKSRVYDCDEHYILTSGNLTRQCLELGSWSGEDPVCNVTCQDPPHENSTTTRTTNSSTVYFEDYIVSYTCKENHRHVLGNLTRVCNGSGDWTGEQPVCKPCMCPCDRIRSQNFIHDPEVLQNRIAEMKKELEVNQKQLSSAVRAKTSAKDERPSAKGVGSILGVGMITFVLVTIVCSDLPMIYRQVRYGS
ncbi:uncharacterized protein LOC125683012 [Ostrea edulis]|uniref:uncharacterized protein LOC125683012 n=1 Tax=Ostrea edulis TaxID=37623 RepID=UPI0024AE91D8|nr:uncharacterized protein LOC125683012 [Ostrea edulis]